MYCTVGVKMLVDVGALAAACGIGFTVITYGTVLVVIQPAAEVSVSVIVYVPAVRKQCEVFWLIESGPPSPKSQLHPVIEPEEMVEASVKFTHSGSQPDVTLEVITGTGLGITVTVTVAVTAGEHPSFAVTVYVIVTAGVAVGMSIAGSLNPVAGDHE